MSERAVPQPSPSPVTTEVLWDSVVGARLEELLYGFLEALKASELSWRAGSNTGVTAPDGGRDLEATFSRPTPEGDLEQERWWIEAKGRADTVARDEVVAGVMSAAGRADLDVYVFCTNSRFSNPTRDWVTEWQKSHPRPKVRLWDRDRLGALARQHPTVTARVLPEALDDSQRLELLVERFSRLGETPTEADLEYYWRRPLRVAESAVRVSAVTMFSYLETQEGISSRPWGTLLKDDPQESLEAVAEALVRLPMLYVAGAVPRPLDGAKVIATSAYLILLVLPRLPASLVSQVFTRPSLLFGGGDALDKPFGTNATSFWYQSISGPVLARVQAELEDVCSSDCMRVHADDNVFSRIEGSKYWRRFRHPGDGESPSGRRLIIEDHRSSCVVGFPLDEQRGCPLIQDPDPSAERLQELKEVVMFRTAYPDRESRKAEVAPE